MSLSALTAGEVAESLSIKQTARVLWDFESGTQGWTGKNNVSPYAASAGCLRGTASGTDPYIYDPNINQTSVKGSAGVAVRIWMSATSPLELFWENEDGGFAATRRVVQTIPGQQWTTVHFDLSTHSEWLNKTISRVRLDPGSNGVSFIIDYVALVDDFTVPTDPFVTQTFNFQPDMQGWTLANQITTFRLEDSKLKGKTSGIDPTITSPVLSAADQGGVVIQFKTDKAATFKLYWSTTEGGFAESRAVTTELNSSTDWQTVKFDLRNHPQWAGKTITGLRIDPSNASGQNFEIDSVTLLGTEGTADTDGDLLDGLDELIYGTDPLQRSSVPGRLTQEKWTNLTNYSTTELYINQSFYGNANQVQLGTLESPNLFFVNHYATRHRGYLTAPTTGTYRFWITGCSGVELYLSTSDSKYHKKRIAQLNPDASTGYGVPITSTNLWDMYVPQMSEDIYMQAGQKYYLEVVQTTGHTGNTHMNIAWARPGQAREVLKTSYLESYYPTADDSQDDDYLPDAWELQYGLDPIDNGRVDIIHQGERGDLDLDGLSNREEYVYGTDPSNPDTDGDGVKDRQEIRLGTNPTASNEFQISEISSLNLQAYDVANTTGVWQAFEGGILGDSFRGDIAYNFSVPENGFYHLEILGKLRGILQGLENFPMRVSIDGRTLQPFSMRFIQSQLSSENIVTPWLQAGDHYLVIHLDNEIGRRKFQLLGLRILTMGGFDSNNNNLPDWMDNQFAESNGMSLVASSSFVSPLFVEGKTRYKGGVVLTSGSAVITTQNGLGDNHWFANVLLSPTVVTPLHAQFENGMVQNSASVEWKAWNTMQNTAIAIRAGDSLKLQAAALGSSTATVTVQGQSYSVADGAYLVKTFPAGVHTIKTVRAGQTVNATVTAYTANFGETLPFYSDFVTWRTYPNVPAALWIDAEPDLLIAARQAYGTGQKIQFSPKRAGTLTFGARLYPGGPLVTLSTTTTVGVADVLETDATSFVGNTEDGYNILRTPIVITNLPPGGRVVLTIFRAGVTFLDGTTVKTLYASDLVNGLAYVDFRYPPEMTGGYCHYISVYDAANNLLGTR